MTVDTPIIVKLCAISSVALTVTIAMPVPYTAVCLQTHRYIPENIDKVATACKC